MILNPKKVLMGIQQYFQISDVLLLLSGNPRFAGQSMVSGFIYWAMTSINMIGFEKPGLSLVAD